MGQVKRKKQGKLQEVLTEYTTVKGKLSSISEHKMLVMQSKARGGKGWRQQRKEQLYLFQTSQMPAHQNNSSQGLLCLFANWPHHSQNCIHKTSNTVFTLLSIDNCAHGGKVMVDKTACALAQIKNKTRQKQLNVMPMHCSPPHTRKTEDHTLPNHSTTHHQCIGPHTTKT